jgi:hypothetical protein
MNPDHVRREYQPSTVGKLPQFTQEDEGSRGQG